MRILIIPDVHGRPFWKKAKEMVGDVDKVIFLGDYHDPYQYEGITPDMSMRNLLEIEEFVTENADKVVMLVGNHDLSYIDGMDVGANRFDMDNLNAITAVFERLDSKMSLAYAHTDNGKTFLFTHAGVVPQWAEMYMPDVVVADAYAFADEVNKWFAEKSHSDALGDVGSSRNGDSDYSSMVWADYSDIIDSYLMLTEDSGMRRPRPNYYQIFGHTQQYDMQSDRDLFIPSIMGDYACLDCHRPFLLEDGVIKEIWDL